MRSHRPGPSRAMGDRWSSGPIAPGCGTFGGIGGARDLIGRGLDEDASMATLDEAASLGITMPDTAERCADGAGERMIGRRLSEREASVTGGIHLTTKVAPGHVSGRGATGVRHQTDLRSVGSGRVNRQEKADRIGEILDELYPDPPVPLDHVDPYTLLVAVALSAQTTDKKVNEVTPALFAAAPTPEAMVALGPDRILELICEIGLAPTKARNLWTAANQIVDAGGEVLPDWEFLESLAGVGHKTASVVMSHAFGVPAFPVDTHIHRLAARWGLSNGTTVERTERDLKAVFAPETWKDRHLQMIYFGREHCPARRHDLASCEICSWAATKKRIRAESMR